MFCWERSPGCTLSVASNSNVDTFSIEMYGLSNHTKPKNKLISGSSPVKFCHAEVSLQPHRTYKMNREQKANALGGTRTPGSSTHLATTNFTPKPIVHVSLQFVSCNCWETRPLAPMPRLLNPEILYMTEYDQ